MILCYIHFYAFALKSGHSARAFAAIFFCAVGKVVRAGRRVRWQHYLYNLAKRPPLPSLPNADHCALNK
jgi:hypothetical protein